MLIKIGGYKSGMKLADILRVIDARREQHGMSDRQLSLKAHQSADLVRNWRRRVEQGDINAGANARSLEAVAAVLGMSHDQLLSGEVMNGAATGFSEGDAAPWAPPDPDRKIRLMAALAPNAVRPDSYVLSKAIPAFDLAVGDVVVVDLGREPVLDQIVVVTIDDISHHTQLTVLRRYLPPYVVPGRHDEKSDLVDSQRIVILGPVVASFRPMPGSDAS